MVPCSGVYFAALSTRLNDLRKANRICVDEDRIGAKFNVQRMAPALDLGTARFHGLGDNRPHVNNATFKLELAALNPRNVEQIVRQPRHVLRLPRDDVQRTKRSLISRGSLLKQRRRCDYRAQWIPEFMSEGRDEVIFLAIAFRERLGCLQQLPAS